VRHIALPAPGDWRQLCIQVARLHARPLDFSRPLWETWIIEGLDKVPGLPRGSFAIYGKLHHALFDGAGGQVFVDALHDLEPAPADEAPVSSEERLYADEALGELHMLGRAATNQLVNGIDIARGLLRAGGEIARMLRGSGGHGGEPLPPRAPRTRFNEPVGPHRSFEAASFALAEFRALREASGAGLSALALAVIGGALGRYLGARGELPERALNAAVALEPRRRPGSAGEVERPGAAYVSLHTGLADPRERLAAIARETERLRAGHARHPFVDTERLAGVLPPVVVRAATGFYAARGLAGLMPPVTSTVVANAAGPAIPLYCSGARLVRYHGLGPLSPGMGLYHSVFSCNDVLTISVVADRERMPDPGFYRACLEESFAELRDAP